MEWQTVIGVAVAGLVSVCSVMLGGAITLIGTVLAWWLGRRAQTQDLRAERLNERLEEVHRWMVWSLKFADAVVGRHALAGEKLDDQAVEALVARVEECEEGLESLGGIGSSLVMYCGDDDVLEGLLRKAGAIVWLLQDELLVIYTDHVVTEKAVVARQELLKVGRAVRAHLDKLRT